MILFGLTNVSEQKRHRGSQNQTLSSGSEGGTSSGAVYLVVQRRRRASAGSDNKVGLLTTTQHSACFFVFFFLLLLLLLLPIRAFEFRHVASADTLVWNWTRCRCCVLQLIAAQLRHRTRLLCNVAAGIKEFVSIIIHPETSLPSRPAMSSLLMSAD